MKSKRSLASSIDYKVFSGAFVINNLKKTCDPRRKRSNLRRRNKGSRLSQKTTKRR